MAENWADQPDDERESPEAKSTGEADGVDERIAREVSELEQIANADDEFEDFNEDDFDDDFDDDFEEEIEDEEFEEGETDDMALLGDDDADFDSDFDDDDKSNDDEKEDDK